MRHLTHSRLWLLPLALVLGACTAILPPNEDDDNVERCSNTSECAQPTDTRLTAVCYVDDGLTQGAPGVCLNEYATVSCNYTAFETTPEDQRPDWVNLALDAAANGAAYAGCEDSKVGTNGCQPDTSGNGPRCADGLTEETFEAGQFCVDLTAEPAILPASIDLAGADVQHAFCAAMFGCDSSFVCNQTVGACQPCDPALPPEADGACQQMWVNGALAEAFNGSVCNDQGTIEPVDIQVGTPNQAPG